MNASHCSAFFAAFLAFIGSAELACSKLPERQIIRSNPTGGSAKNVDTQQTAGTRTSSETIDPAVIDPAVIDPAVTIPSTTESEKKITFTLIQPEPGASFFEGDTFNIKASIPSSISDIKSMRVLAGEEEICVLNLADLTCSATRANAGKVILNVEAKDSKGKIFLSDSTKIMIFKKESTVAIFSPAAGLSVKVQDDESLIASQNGAVFPDDGFTVIENQDKTISIKSNKNNKYLTVTDTTSPVKASSSTINAAQKFQLIPNANGITSAIYSAVTQTHMEANQTNGWKLYASWNAANGNWQQFAFRSQILTADAKKIVRSMKDNFPIGINLNYYNDDNHNRPSAPTIQSVLKDARMGYLRYPGGGKSNWHLWSSPPWDKPQPRQGAGWYRDAAIGRDLLDTDEYIAYAREIGATPYIVVGIHKFSETGITQDEYLEAAVNWVKYTNITKKYGVKYWEIGNEVFNIFTPEEFAPIFIEFSRAMKAVDPTIQIGTNGYKGGWYETLLPLIAKDADFISNGIYSAWAWGSYDYFLQNDRPDQLGPAEYTIDAIHKNMPSADADRMKMVIYEFNSKDYSGAWTSDNNLGHALVNFDFIGQILAKKEILFAMQWPTRWMDDTVAADIWYALGPNNEWKPVGWPLKLWGKYAKDTLVKSERDGGKTLLYTTISSVDGKMTIYLLNPARDIRSAHVRIYNALAEGDFGRATYSGMSSEDTAPTYREDNKASFIDNELAIDLPALSITILTQP